MSTMMAVTGPVLDGLDDQALLDLATHTLTTIGTQPLDTDLDDATLADTVQRLHELETIVMAEKLRRIAAIEVRQAWRGAGARSTADLLAQRLRLTSGEARVQADTAVGLLALPQTTQALQAGQIGVGQAQVATRAAQQLRPDMRDDLDRLVADHGGGLDRRQLRHKVEAWTHTVDPAALAGRDGRAWANRRLSLAEGPDGGLRGAFELDPVGGATLTAALDPLARKTDHDDERSYPQRLADALIKLARRSPDIHSRRHPTPFSTTLADW